MSRLIKNFLQATKIQLVLFGLLVFPVIQASFASSVSAAGDCEKGSFFGFPSWWKYIKTEPPECAPKLTELNDIWKIGLAIIEILLRIAILVAIAFVLYAGIKYSASRGNPDKTQSAKTTLTDALLGLVIAVVATAVVAFIAGRFTTS